MPPARSHTLDGQPPLGIGHRGLPGLHREETRAAYDSAAQQGANSLEEDLHLTKMTKDRVPVVRHKP